MIGLLNSGSLRASCHVESEVAPDGFRCKVHQSLDFCQQIIQRLKREMKNQAV
jgi:hypothetical protein